MEKYLPVSCDFFDVMEVSILKKETGKIFYFDEHETVQEVKGTIKTWETKKDGEFLITHEKETVRIDRIITLYGKPGPMFDTYDGYSIPCFKCYVKP